jgi:hypothetical protein
MVTSILDSDEIPLCIKTDAAIYDHPVEFFETSDMFKDDPKGTIFDGFVRKRYYDYLSINQSILDEFEKVNSISFHGCPGTGKTHTVKNDHTYDFCATTSNMCCLNMKADDAPNAKTLYSLFMCWDPEMWTQGLKKLKNKTLWIDEYSMITRKLWGFIVIAAIQYGTKLIISGDYRQIGPIGEYKISLINPIVDRIMGARTTLTKDYRNDADLIKLRERIEQNTDNPRLLNHIFAPMLGDREHWVHLDRHLSWTRDNRDRINEMILNDRGYDWSYLKVGKKYQVKTSPGVVVVGVHNLKECGEILIAKGDIWKITDMEELSDGSYEYQMTNLNRSDSKSIDGVTLAYYYRLGFCTTTHSSQGLTIKEQYAVHEVQGMIYRDPDILYTGVTRGTKCNDLNFIKDKYEPTSIIYPNLKVSKDDEDDFVNDKSAKVCKKERYESKDVIYI